MRHVRSILYATALAPVIWALAGLGFGHRGTTGVITGMGLLLVLLSGFAYAFLLFAPISPAGPLTGGGLFLIASVWAVVAPASYAGLWPGGTTGSDLAQPGYGAAALLAVPLIATALNARRWETYEPPELPLVGRLGRLHGVAKPTEPPMAALETAVLTSVTDPDSTVVVLDTKKLEAAHEADATIAIPRDRPPVLIPGSGPADDSTIIIPAIKPDGGAVAGPDDDATIVVPVGAAAERNVKRKELVPEKVEPAEADRPAPVSPADVTQVIPRDLGGETQVILAPGKRQPPADADETQMIRLPDSDETQVIKPHVTHPLRAGSDTGSDSDSDTDSGSGSDETQVIDLRVRPAAAGPVKRAAGWRGSSRTARHRAAAAVARQRGEANATRHRRRAAAARRRAEAAAARQGTEAAAARQGAEAARRGADAAATPQGAETAAARQGAEAAAARQQTPPPDRPATPPPDRPATPPSIADAERPDPAADPTIRLGQVTEPAADRDPANGRSDSASHAERPADESADDTRRLTSPTIPGPRRHPDDETD